MTWENRDRLLLAPLGKVLLCAAFPETGTLDRPTSQPLRPIRVLKRKETPQKEGGSQKKQKRKPQQRHSATTSESSNSPSGSLPPEAAAQSATALQQPQMPYDAQVAMESMQGENIPSSRGYQIDGSAKRQMLSPLQLPVEQYASSYPQAPRGVLGAPGEQIVYWLMGTGAAGSMADPSNLNSEAVKVSEMFDEYVNFDGHRDQFDSAS